MQDEDRANRTSDPDVDDTDRPVSRSESAQYGDSEQRGHPGRRGDLPRPTDSEQPREPDQPADADPDGVAWADPLQARWHEAQHKFVDDPAGAVREAATLVQSAAERATSAAHTDVGPDPSARPTQDTEQLRITMQRYNDAFELLVDISSRDTA